MIDEIFNSDFEEYFVRWTGDLTEEDFAYRSDCQSYQFLLSAASYALDENQDDWDALLEEVADFLAENPWAQDIDWMLDYEPYIIDQWDDESLQPGIIENFLGNLQEFKEVIAPYDVNLILDVPIFYSIFEYENATLLHAVSNIVDEILLMSYRDTFEGNDGILSFINNSVAILINLNKPFYLALETQEIEPDKITFFEEGRAALHALVDLLDVHFEDQDLYRGTAVHYLHPYLNLLQI
ncbi:hypothetical protein HOJ01_03080 [bacterium]|nr:hypothetical protein [bacterium]MBT6293768.1 hypothetical protein [bacterium]